MRSLPGCVYPAARTHQRGQAFLYSVLLAVVGASALIYSLATPTNFSVDTDRKTSEALAQARDALIGWAVRQTSKPGALPCPDTNNDGNAEGMSGNNCPSYIGRLPWRTLNLPDIRDGSGERLWYALSPNFRNLAPPTGPVLNSDTPGQLTVTGMVPANGAIAIVFAPGGVVGTQVRDAANQNTVTNYLEGENANGDTVYVAGAATGSFNDRLLVITPAMLLPVLEYRVAREVRTLLQQYKAGSSCNCYPWPDISDGNSNFGLNRGRFPYGTALPEGWGSGGIPVIATWLIDNEWFRLIFYAVGRNYLEAGGAGCSAGYCQDPTLSVNGVSGYELVLLTPGPMVTGDGRPVAFPWTNWAPYLNDTENSDNSNDLFVTPASTAYARNRILTVP